MKIEEINKNIINIDNQIKEDLTLIQIKNNNRELGLKETYYKNNNIRLIKDKIKSYKLEILKLKINYYHNGIRN